MFDDLPPDLDRLHTLRVWHTMWLQRIDAKIAALARRQTEEERGRRNRPAPRCGADGDACALPRPAAGGDLPAGP
ncbi:hypothetical protein [Streptomyces albogriseolus]|uniref:hypothetical protein n=1 Tax=Streptomyces albogriseolus TaxID=1887 RepID=UPI00224D5AFF|nr:hypothetical protein [Streptomyces viridodiastaticus]MCX4625124.1 hypothetical protein [Streptomyces viridodiastaticus]